MASDLDAWNDFFGDLSYENGDNPSWQVHELDTTAPFNFDIEPAAGEVSAFQNSVTQDLSFGSGEQLPALPHTTLSNTTFEQAMARLSIVEERVAGLEKSNSALRKEMARHAEVRNNLQLQQAGLSPLYKHFGLILNTNPEPERPSKRRKRSV